MSGDEGGWKMLLARMDRWALIPVVVLFFTGIVAIYSASQGAHGVSGHFAFRQVIWGGISMVAYFLVLRIGHDWFLRRAYSIFGLALLLLLIVLLKGHVAKGAQSWISLGPFRLQPSEFGKVALALGLARFCCIRPPRDPRAFLEALGFAGLAGVLVLVQPDLGSAVVYGVMTLAGLIVAGANRKYLLFLVGGVMALLPVAWGFLKEYQRLRLMVFINPYVDPLGAGYNVIQSRIAVGAGGLWGRGFLAGTQSKLRFLPEPHTDFIFSVFAEEFGFAGCFIVLLLFSFLIWRLFSAATMTRDLRAKVLVAMIAVWIWFQLFESVAMSMGLAPVTGLPMPLFSYGGSSLLSTALALALVQSVYVAARKSYSRV